MQNNNPALPNNDQGEDKTIIYSSSNSITEKKESDNEKTQIQDSPASKPITTDGAKEIVNTPPPLSDSIPDKKAELDSKKTDSKISPGLFAGGMAAAAAGGVAVGTIFSDDIKEIFTAENLDAIDSPETEVQEVNSGQAIDGSAHQSNGNASNFHQTAFHEGELSNNSNIPSANHQFSSLEISTNDTDGNTYSVSLLDFDGDGSIDSQTVNIQLVDGTSVTYTETGENLNPLFSEITQIAMPNDYQGQPGFVNFFPPENEFSPGNDSYVYEVQAGDTLSEIAEANNTSIAHIMELNPEIVNPHTIYTGDNLLIPENDNISNPYAGGVGLDGNHNNNSDSNQLIISDDSNQPIISDDSMAEGTLDANYDEVDWASFSDDNASIENSSGYDEVFSQTDFDSIETPESYIDLTSNNFDNTDVTSDFI
jgi:LysM repeat protein